MFHFYLNEFRGPCRLLVVRKVLQVLLNCVDGIVHVHRSIGIGHEKVLREGLLNGHVHHSDQELSDHLPAQRCDKARSVLHLDQNSLEVLGHRHTAQFDDKVSNFESRTLGLDLGVFLGVVKVGDAQHELVEQTISD